MSATDHFGPNSPRPMNAPRARTQRSLALLGAHPEWQVRGTDDRGRAPRSQAGAGRNATPGLRREYEMPRDPYQWLAWTTAVGKRDTSGDPVHADRTERRFTAGRRHRCGR